MRCHFLLSSHSLHVINDVHYSRLLLSQKTWKVRELKETYESQGICLKSQGILLSEIHFPSQLEDPNFENFEGEHAPRPLNGVGLMVELNLGLEKSGNFILSGKWQP